MFKTGLQLFAEAVAGKKIVYLYRLAKNASQEAGKILLLRQRMKGLKARMRIPLPQRTEPSVHRERQR